MKKSEPFNIYQVSLVIYCVVIGALIMVLGVIALLKVGLWLVGVIVGLPLAIYGGLRLKRYVFEGGLEEDFITNKK